MKQLLEKIFLQYVSQFANSIIRSDELQIQRVLELALPEPKDVDQLRQWLCKLELVFDLTNEIVSEVSAYNIPDMDYDSIRSTLFSDYIDEYVVWVFCSIIH